MTLTSLRSWQKVSTIVSDAAHDRAAPAEALRTLREQLGFDCAVLTGSATRRRERHRVVVNSDYPRDVASYLADGYVRTCPGYACAHERQLPMRICDTPFDFHETRTYRDVLGPAGFREGVTLPFLGAYDTGGFLAMSSEARHPLNREGRTVLTLLAPALAAISHVATAGMVSHAAAEDLVAEFDAAAGRLRWSGYDQAARSPLGEATLADFARQICATGRHRCGFYDKGPEGAWWWVRGFRREVPGGGARVSILLTRQSPPSGLTLRELDVLGQLSLGLTNQDIADRLGIAVRTVKTHIEAALGKLQQSSRVGLASAAVDADLRSRHCLLAETTPPPPLA